MSGLRGDLIAFKALISGDGLTLLDALDRVTGDAVAQGRVTQRSIALIGALNEHRPDRPGRARPTLREMHDKNNRPELMALFDRAIAAAAEE